MVTVKYSRAKLIGLAVVCGLGAAFFLGVLISPETFSGNRRGRFLTSGFGYYFLTPGFALFCLYGTWRTLSLALSSLVALEFGSASLKVNAVAGSKTMRWTDITDVYLETSGKQVGLCILSRQEGFFGQLKARISPGLLESDGPDLAELVQAIHYCRTAHLTGANSTTDVSPEVLAEPATAGYAPPQPQRRGFGRKLA